MTKQKQISYKHFLHNVINGKLNYLLKIYFPSFKVHVNKKLHFVKKKLMQQKHKVKHKKIKRKKMLCNLLNKNTKCRNKNKTLSPRSSCNLYELSYVNTHMLRRSR